MDEAGLNAFGRPDDDDVRIDDEAKERSCFPRGSGPHISKPRYHQLQISGAILEDESS
jgi:hypothetical protein